MQEIRDDILERTNQMKSLCLRAQSTAIQTVSDLADQNEQLENVDLRLSAIDTSLKETRQNINRLKSVTQRVVDSVRTKFQRRNSSAQTRRKSSLVVSSLAVRRESSPRILNRPTSPVTDGQIDETLYDIEHIVHSLKGIAQTMNDQLVGQADTVKHIQEHMIKSTTNIEQQTTDISKLTR